MAVESMPFAKPSSTVVEDLKSDAANGLSSAEARRRLDRYGPNRLAEPPRPGLLAKLIEQVSDFLVLILIAAALVSALLGEFVDSAVIIAIVIVNAAIGLIQEAKAEQALEALKKMASPNARVLREGDHLTIPAADLVPGDIILIHTGDRLPADVRLLETQNLQADEAPLTGESLPVEKDASAVLGPDTSLADRRNMAFFGTTMTYGRAKGIVVATGMQTEIGKIAGALQAIAPEKTPLQQNLASLGKVLGIAIMGICGVVFCLGLLRREPAFEMFLTSVSLAVAAIPEGLPAVVTVVLAIGVKRMAARNSIMRKLSAVETLGCTTVICSDKTGTLTQNQMTVVKAYVFGSLFHVTGEGYAPRGRFIPVGKDALGLDLADDAPCERSSGLSGLMRLLLAGAALNNDSILTNSAEDGKERWEVIGDPTEGALVVAASKAGIDKPKLESLMPRVFELPFDSARKRMTTVHALGQKRVAFMKGAPEVVLGHCSKVALPREGFSHAGFEGILDVETAEMTDELRADFAEMNLNMARNALRVIAVAYTVLDDADDKPDPDSLEKNLAMVGLLGMIDPPRAEVPEAVGKCKKAGIIPIMITGDHQATASAIAKALEMSSPEQLCMTGKELDSISDEDLEKVAVTTRVYARVSPEHKMRIVDALKRQGHVVAMTGDGVNDAPALKRAEIGVAMGITGTDVAKETSDMILADDNFSTIVAAVEEGRIIYSNIAKFVLYLLSCNMGEILTIFSSMMVNLPLPLRPVQLLWLNLVTDSLPALALGVEKGESDVMSRPPRNPREPILTRERWAAIGIQAVLIAATTLGAFLYALARPQAEDPLPLARTMAFCALVTSELIRAFSARSETESIFSIGLFSNRSMLAANAVSFLLLLAVIELPFLRPVFHVTRLSLSDWGIVFAFALVPAAGAEIMKPVRGLGRR